ncbi:glycosyltransferase family 4 protein [Nostoc sp. UHCC 0870]|nr:glycosyltransferase family 4 protein [Nostoc sp. UHCC 0870]UKO97601.1 glycosyltransferase family 4 protein [Nostoc sp. UHCC 0870]
MVTTVPDTLSAFLIPFAHHFRAQGWRVDAMTQGVSQNVECIKAFDQVWDVEWSRNPLNPFNLVVAPYIIQQVIQQEKYDLVHVHTPVAAFVTRYALKDLNQQKRPLIIYTAHGFHFYNGGKLLKNAIFLALEKLAGRWTDYLVVINREDEETAKKHRLISPEYIRYMPGIGVDLQYYNPQAVSDAEVAQLRQELKLASDTPLFLSVAEFIPRKHPQDVLKAFALLARPQACLAFAGDGFLMNQTQQLASQLGVENQVRFLGVRRDIPTLMRAATATILASDREGLPRCVMESMSMETPVIGTDIRGTRDLLKEGCGLLVKVGDIEALAQGMAWILDNPEKAQIITKEARERITSYELSYILKEYEALYAEAMLRHWG